MANFCTKTLCFLSSFLLQNGIWELKRLATLSWLLSGVATKTPSESETCHDLLVLIEVAAEMPKRNCREQVAAILATNSEK